MEIRDLVIPGCETLVLGTVRLQASCTVFYTLDQFLKLKTNGSMPVYQQGKYIGNLALIDVIKYLHDEYKIEKDKRYRLARSLMSNVTKIKSLARQISSADHRLKIDTECENMINRIKGYI